MSKPRSKTKGKIEFYKNVSPQTRNRIMRDELYAESGPQAWQVAYWLSELAATQGGDPVGWWPGENITTHHFRLNLDAGRFTVTVETLARDDEAEDEQS